MAPSDVVERPGLDDRERALDPTIVKVWRATGALIALIPLAILVTLGFVILEGYGWIVLVVALALLWLQVGWLPPARYARWRWQLTPLALELRYGVVVHQYEAVPYFRIQQIDITQGPIDRMLGLATLVVATASASGSATLPGIAADDAPPVRAELLARAAEAVAEHPGDLQDAV